MPEDPQQPDQPEGGASEDAAREDVAPEDAAREGGAPEDDVREDAPREDALREDAPADAGEPAPAEPGEEEEEEAGEADAAPGPEIEGAEELAQAARPEAAEGEEPEGDTEAPEDEPGVARAERPRPGRGRREDEKPADEIIPGAHLEPDLVLEEQRSQEEGEFGEYGEYAEAPVEEGEVPEEAPAEPEPVARQPLDLAADARYQATGKRKSAVARVILKPGEGTYRINERHLDEYFPRVRLQRLARQPLEAAGYQSRMDVVARIHGGGVSAQAMALRHGVARALVEADPALRGELKGRGYLTRDPRVKERKKAGLKKARKRPQFSKR
jgi:small subunit ribosomal protein S9